MTASDDLVTRLAVARAEGYMSPGLLLETMTEIEQLQERCEFYAQDAAAAWDKCEERCQEAQRLRVRLRRITECVIGSLT